MLRVNQVKPQDADLLPEQFEELNRRFYGNPASPHVYVRHRVRALMLAGTSDEKLREAQQGVRFGNFVAGWPHGDPLLEEPVVRGYVLAESVVMFHHAAEALIRMVLAHLDEPECPWLEMRRLTFAGYKQAIDKLRDSLEDDTVRSRLMRVFYGTEGPGTSSHRVVNEQWHDLADGVSEMLAVLITHLQAEGDLYNAAKHGLAAVGGEDHLKLLPEQSDLPLLSADGHCLTYLTLDPSSPRWMRTVSWINAEERLALATMASNFMENLWVTARAKYAPDLDGQELPKLLGPSILRQMQQIVSTAAGNVTISMYLRYLNDGGFSGRVSYTLRAQDNVGRPPAVKLGGDDL